MPDYIEVPAHELTAEHFIRHPIWRYLDPEEASDPEVDESFVAPHSRGVSKGDNAGYLVRATFTLKSQLQLPGFVEVGLLGQRVEFTPGVVFASGKAVEALGKETAVRLERILKTKDAQPVSWELDVCILGERGCRTGAIEKPGFAQALALLVQLGRLRRMR